MATKPIEAGQIVALTSGDYSDYQVQAFAKVLKVIDKDVWLAAITACRDKNYKIYTNESRVAPWLTENGYIEVIEYTELHIDDHESNNDWEDA